MAKYKDPAFDWVDIHDAFMQISKANADCSKSSEGYFRLDLLPTNYWEEKQEKRFSYIYIEFGGYQIGDWSRHQQFGPFDNLEQAWDEAVKRVKEAYDIVNAELQEDSKPIQFYPAVLL